MIPFEEWQKKPEQPLNESVNYSDAVRKYMSSPSDVIRAALSPHILATELSKQSQDIAELENQILDHIKNAKEEAETVQEETVQEEAEEISKDYYSLYRDKEETFECNISVTGASLSSAQARLIIDTPNLNIIFYGKLYKDGRCMVQLGKMTALPEESRGRIRLEVIVDDTLFVPWESACVVEGSKKVTVDIKGKKSVSVNIGTN
jgi:hypothetical protein